LRNLRKHAFELTDEKKSNAVLFSSQRTLFDHLDAYEII